MGGEVLWGSILRQPLRYIGGLNDLCLILGVGFLLPEKHGEVYLKENVVKVCFRILWLLQSSARVRQLCLAANSKSTKKRSYLVLSDLNKNQDQELIERRPFCTKVGPSPDNVSIRVKA